MRFILSLLSISLLTSQSIDLSETTRLSYKGNLGIDYWHFPRKAPNPHSVEANSQFFGEIDLVFQFESPFEIRIHPFFFYDSENEDRNRLYFKDAYFDYFSDSFEFRVGYQSFSWKMVESVSQADFLNQTDLEVDFLDSDMKLPELSTRIRYIPDTDVEQSWELYYFIKFQPTNFPVGKNRYSFSLDVSNEEDRFFYQSADKEYRPQLALSYQRILFDEFDSRWFYFNGYNRFPGLVTMDLQHFFHEYRLVHKAGMTFQGELGSWLVKGEFVQTSYQKDVLNQLGQKIKPSYLAYTLGFEYTLYSAFLADQDLGIILEFIGDSDTGKKANELESFRPFQNHIFSGFRYAFNNTGDRSLLFGGFYNYKNEDLILQLQYEERLFNAWKIKIQYADFIVENEPLSRFSHADRYSFKLTYNF